MTKVLIRLSTVQQTIRFETESTILAVTREIEEAKRGNSFFEVLTGENGQEIQYSINPDHIVYVKNE